MANSQYKTIDQNYPDLAYDRTLSFAGVLRRYFNVYQADGRNIGISRHWNEKTKGTYIDDYNLRLLPLLDRNMPIKDYTVEYFDEVIERLRMRHHYSESTVRHYRHLIYRVCEAGYQHGHCDDILWGSCYSIGERTEKSMDKFMTILKKSFTIQEEFQILQLLKKNPEYISGEELGLLIMLFVGTRNNEACGINYGDIKPMVEHPESYCLWLYKTTELESNQLKASGKTRNADRILPILDNLSAYLMRRVQYLEELILSGELVLTGIYADKTVLDLPVVCRGNQYLKRCSAKDLTSAGKELLKEIKFSSKELAGLDLILHSREFFAEGIKEKDPTTYLFRRNAGTHFYTLGFSMAEIQYYIGQDVEDLYETRNSFVNEEKLYAIKKLLDNHPFNFVFFPVKKEQKPESIHTAPYVNNVSEAAYKVVADNDDTHLLFSLKAREPKEKISVSINCNNPVEITLLKKSEPTKANRTVNTHRVIRRVYEDE